MLMNRTRSLVLCLAMMALFVGSLLQAQVSRIPSTASEDEVTGQNETIKMQAKLVHAQKVLEGLVSHDFEMIEKAAAGLKKISLTPVPDLAKAGDRTDEQVYEHFRMEFARLAGRLEMHARKQEPEATAYVYQNLTDSCIACHDYIRDYVE